MPLTKVRLEQIDKFLKAESDAGPSPRYFKLLRTVLSMALDQGLRWQLVETNAAKLSASVKQNASQGRALSEDQAKALLEAAKAERLGALGTVLLAVGLCRG